jgi:hypothetical protein
MSDEKAAKKRNRINVEKIQNFFDENGISMECPICKTDEWNIPNGKSVGGNALPWGTGTGDMFMTGLPVLVMICTKCKFVRQHSLLEDDIPGAIEEF